MRILTVNTGSTSTKVDLVDGGRSTRLTMDDALADSAPDAIAHRVVHGGDRTAVVIVDDTVRDELETLVELAPLHQRPALVVIDRCRQAWPGVPNVACFDTAFHATIPVAARAYALPPPWRERVRQYGFHGLSYAWATARVREQAPSADRIVIAHLGGGASLCGVRQGRSVFTTMGFTPLDGLVMATRPGSIDPGAVLYLQRHAPDVGALLERSAGLVGLCGTDDMREVRRRIDNGDAEAGFAFAVWRHRLVALLGACIAALEGIDALVFTGGIGEHDAPARAAVAEAFEWLGVHLDPARNDRHESVISAPDSAIKVVVVESREDLQMADEAAAVLAP
ncbi:MAG: acetate/propionate family kinase [Acidimicrobiia bacterium]